MIVCAAPRPTRWLSLLFAIGLLTSFSARVMGAADPRELKAREEFAAGRYEVALDMFAKLYAETLHPNYLRNVGRCYQNMGEPDKAISAFREYLRKAEDLPPKQRAEIDRYILEMEALLRQRAAGGFEHAPALQGGDEARRHLRVLGIERQHIVGCLRHVHDPVHNQWRRFEFLQ